MESPAAAAAVAGPPVTLIIKAPNQKYTDQTISCFLDWTVGKLKCHLSRVYPSKPSTKDQRLVYSGRLLPDHLQLKDILRKSSECSRSTTPPSSQEPLHTNVSSSSSGVRHRNLPQAQSNPMQSHPFSYVMQGNVGNQFSGQGVPAGIPVYPSFSPLQMIWWQQMYVRQYYMQYQAAVSAQAVPSTESASPPAPQPTNSERAPANEPPVAPNVIPQENRPANQNVQMNAQGGPVMNEEDFNRDWLDWMYTFSRAAILLSIVYFYSSFSRFVMVMGAMLLVYLHQAGWFPFRQEAVQQPAANNVDMNHDGQNVNNAGLEEMERLMDDGIDEDSGEDAIDVNAEQHPGFMASAWSFITTFFTSLIPEGPPQVGN
nr:homocysteine-responsive endoplasmic reticulum-resident ubiquitin-like domain member 2 protein isoform X3 [Pogona vitticeps]